MNRKRVALLAVVAVAIAAFFVLDLDRYLSLEYFRTQREHVQGLVESNPITTAVAFFAIYISVTALSLPGAAIMTLVGGAVFGLLWGTVIVSFASSIGATLAFLVARFLFRDAVQSRLRSSLERINRGMEKDGAFYLFALRLVPAFPFFIINLVMGLTPLRTGTFYLVSQAGMLPGTLVYINAGTQLAEIDSPGGILSPALIASFVLLGAFPLVARKVIEFVRARRVYRGFERPKRYDRNLVVIGAGSSGLVASYIAAAVKARVTLIEKHRMGGDCLNTGCVPSKALIRSARFLADARRAQDLGFRSVEVDFDFADVMERVQRVIRTIEPHDSVQRYTSLGVDCVQGRARIRSPWVVEVDGRELATRAIVIAAGARPFVPPIPGIEEVGYYTSDTLWELRKLPRRLVVMGGGPIGCELAQCFARFGSQVTQVEMLPRVLPREDEEISEMIATRLREEGVALLTQHKVTGFRVENGRKLLIAEHEGQQVQVEFDALLVAVGRVANTEGYGLEELGIGITPARTIETDEFLRTRFPNVFACGDVAGPYQFTHVGSHQAWFATVNALFGNFRRFRADYSVIPWATFTDPEVARVGLNEQEARERGIDCEVTRYHLAELDRAITEEAGKGVVKVLTVPGKDRILGATIVGEHAGDIIAEYVAAMRHRFGMNKILGTIHIYPTLAEANKYAAGEWKRAHAPRRVLGLLDRYHGWRLGRSAR